MKVRNIQLDYLKIVLSILVIALHIGPFDYYNLNHYIIEGIARIAVPIFFIINGYYIFDAFEKKGALSKVLIRILKLYIVWMVIYYPFYFRDTDLIQKFIKGYFHLWYLPALMGGFLILYGFKKLNASNRIILLSAFVLFLTGWAIQKLRLAGYDFPMHNILYKDGSSRNFLFMGFPFIAIGYYIRKVNLNSIDFFKNKKSLYWILTVSFVLLLIESHFGLNDRKISSDFYLITPIIGTILFILFLNKPTVKMEDDFISKLYIAIYFFHPFVIIMVNHIFPKYDATMTFCTVVFLTLIFSAALIQLNRHIKIFL